MRLFGLNITRATAPVITAAAPQLPAKRGDKALTEVLPPFGTNPPTRPVSNVPDYEQRAIQNDPRELWYLALPSKLTPKQVLQILRAALGGDIWQQWQLCSLMLDSWPMFRKCSHKLRSAVASVKFRAVPFVVDEGDEPTQSAKDKADIVNRAMRSMQPDPSTDEEGWYGTKYDITDGVLSGLTMSELLWWNKGGEFLPRASAWVHPRHYTFGNDGRIAVFDDMYNRLNYALARSPGQPPPAGKFLISQFKSRSGSSLGAGLMRPLAWDWSAVMYNREWMLNFAQKYGNPFLDATTKPGTPPDELTVIDNFLSQAGSQGWIRHVEGSTVEVHPAQSLGADNAQVRLMEMADNHCMELLLGQQGTTKSVPGKLGAEDTHQDVEQEIVAGIAQWVAGVLTYQFAHQIVKMNFGQETDELPTVEADFTGVEDPASAAERMQVVIQAGIPVHAEELYKILGLTMPEDGDKVLVGGRLGKLASTEEEVGGAPEPPQIPGMGPEAEEDDAPEPVAASLRKAIRHASSSELHELRELVVRAGSAKHANGEWDAVKAKIQQLRRK